MKVDENSHTTAPKHTPTVDVVIPAYNAEKFIEKTLQSVVDQTYPIQKIIVVNDGSTDQTLQTLQKFADQHPQVLVITKPNGGHCSARNVGIVSSTSDYIALLDADDLWAPQKIEAQVQMAKNHPSAGVIYCDYRVIDENDQLVKKETEFRAKPRLKGSVTRDLIREGNRISGSASAVLIKGELLKKNLFDETLVTNEDWDVWVRLSRITEFDFVDQPLVWVRRHQNNLSSNTDLMIQHNLASVVKHLGGFGFFEKRKILIDVLLRNKTVVIIQHFAQLNTMLRSQGINFFELPLLLFVVIPFRMVRKLLS